MHFVEVLERLRQLRQHCSCVGEVHPADVVALEGIDEALGHAVALRAAHGRVHRCEAQRPGDVLVLVRDVGAAVVGQELQRFCRSKLVRVS